MSSTARSDRPSRADDTSEGTGPARVYAWVFGLAFVAVGVWGFVETGFSPWTWSRWTTTETDATVLWFRVNPLHDLVHLLVGAGLLAGAAISEGASRVLVLLVAVVYAVVGIGGFFAIGEEWNVLALNEPDNWLHIGTAALGLAAVIASDRRQPALRSGR